MVRSNALQFQPHVDSAVLDIYFAELGKGADYCEQLAFQTWRGMSPIERLALQLSALHLADGNLGLSQAYARSMLLLVYAESCVRQQ